MRRAVDALIRLSSLANSHVYHNAYQSISRSVGSGSGSEYQENHQLQNFPSHLMPWYPDISPTGTLVF